MKRAKRGAEVIYVPGHHDEMFRQFSGMNFGGVQIRKKAIHTTADGRRLLVLHGDEGERRELRQPREREQDVRDVLRLHRRHAHDPAHPAELLAARDGHPRTPRHAARQDGRSAARNVDDENV